MAFFLCDPQWDMGDVWGVDGVDAAGIIYLCIRLNAILKNKCYPKESTFSRCRHGKMDAVWHKLQSSREITNSYSIIVLKSDDHQGQRVHLTSTHTA